MFVRWQSRRRSRAEFGFGNGDIRWMIVLVETTRVNGKPRQRHIAYLGSMTESAIDIIHQRCHFRDRLSARLNQLHITVDDRNRIEASITQKVPRPSAA